MTTVVSLLRGINVVGNNKIKMDELRALYESLGLRDVQTYIQSGNVVFRTQARGAAKLSQRLEDAVEENFGFRPRVIVRTLPELRDVIARNPFAKRGGLDPAKLLVFFLADLPSREACDKTLAINVGPEELRMSHNELFIYFPMGQGQSKLAMGRVEKALGTAATGRNWNTVTKLLELAQALEGS